MTASTSPRRSPLYRILLLLLRVSLLLMIFFMVGCYFIAQPSTRVIVLEMIGYFSDEPGSQSYPLPILKGYYPDRGNFITVVSRWNQGKWIGDLKAGMNGATDLPVYSFRGPASLPGIDYSDHRNYWPHDIPAAMITNTAFYRNTAYHTEQDTADRLDYHRMGKVVVGVYEAIRDLTQ